MATAAAEKGTLRVAIEAQITQGVQGGLEQYLMALAAGLRDEAGQDWMYTVLASPEEPDWLRPFIGADHQIVARPAEAESPGEGLKRWLGPMRAPAGRLWRQTRRIAGQDAPERAQPAVVASAGFIEGLQADVIHFPYVAHYEHSPVPTRADDARPAAPAFPAVLHARASGMARSGLSGGNGPCDAGRCRLRFRAARHRQPVRRAGGKGRDHSAGIVVALPRQADGRVVRRGPPEVAASRRRSRFIRR